MAILDEIVDWSCLCVVVVEPLRYIPHCGWPESNTLIHASRFSDTVVLYASNNIVIVMLAGWS